MRISVIISILFLIIIGCKKDGFNNSEHGILLAEVSENRFYLSDLDGMITASNAADSSLQINAFIESWLRKSVVLDQASKKMSPTMDIEKMVEDYRTSLLVHNYKRQFVQSNLDTVVTSEQETNFYELTKDQYLTSTAICKAWIIKIPDDKKGLEKFYKNWKKRDTSKIMSYVKANATFEYNSYDKYIPLSKVMSYLPPDMIKESALQKNTTLQKHHNDAEYFIQVSDIIQENKVPPLSYIKDRIRQVILHQREEKLLQSLEEKVYQSYLKNNKIKVHFK